MLSLFPSFFDWNWYIPFVFRIVLAYHFFNTGLAAAKHGDGTWKVLGATSAAIGALFVAGLWVQPSAIAGSILAAVFFSKKTQKPRFLKDSRAFYVLLGIVSLSLLFLGPGPYAFDLPL
jgi:hypothetical protein